MNTDTEVARPAAQTARIVCGVARPPQSHRPCLHPFEGRQRFLSRLVDTSLFAYCAQSAKCAEMAGDGWEGGSNFFDHWRLATRPSSTSATRLEYCCLGAGFWGSGEHERRGAFVMAATVSHIPHPSTTALGRSV